MALIAVVTPVVLAVALLLQAPPQPRASGPASDPQAIRIARVGTQPSLKGPADNFTGTSAAASDARGPDAAKARERSDA